MKSTEIRLARIADRFVCEHRSQHVEPWFGLLLANICSGLRAGTPSDAQGLPLRSTQAALAMLRDLGDMIDTANGGEMATSLMELLDYIGRGLSKPATRAEFAQEALRLLEGVHAAWSTDAGLFPLKSRDHSNTAHTLH